MQEKTLISFITQFIQIYHAFPFVIYYIGFPFFMLCVVVVFSTGWEHEFIASNPFESSESLYFPGEMATELL